MLRDESSAQLMAWRKRGDSWDNVEAALAAFETVSVEDLQQQMSDDLRCGDTHA